MTIIHHPDDATLMGYAAGSLPVQLSAVVAVHLDACAHCRRELRLMEDIGHSMLQDAGIVRMNAPAPVMALRRSQADVYSSSMPAGEAVGVPASGLSRRADPLTLLIGGSLDDVKWRRLGPGIWHHRLETTDARGGDLRLLKVGPGRAMPDHGHRGTELTLILHGSYADSTGRYCVGDLADLDENVEHQPIADADTGCICLIASEHKVRFKGLLSRLVQPLSGM
jgi:putative transcriptional regulator